MTIHRDISNRGLPTRPGECSVELRKRYPHMTGIERIVVMWWWTGNKQPKYVRGIFRSVLKRALNRKVYDE